MAFIVRNDEVMAGGNRFARALDASGVARRGVVAGLLGNSREQLWTYRGTTGSGRRFTPMSWRWTPEEVDYVVGNCEAEAFVADARYAEAALAASHHIAPERRFAAGGPIAGFRPWAEVLEFSADEYPDALCGDTMMYTSGTTGRPKGVQRASFPEGPPPTITAQAGAQMLTAFLASGEHTGAHVVCGPLYHSGPNAYCDGALLLGSDVILHERFEAEAVLASIEEYRAQSIFMVPTHFVRLLRLPEAVRRRYDLSSLELVLHGAAPVAPDVKRRMIEWLGPILMEFYGGTEGGGVQISSREWLERPGSVGRPRPGTSIHILDVDGSELPPRQEGEIYFPLGDAPFVYKDDPEKTAGSRRGDLFTLGDIGYTDDDGYLFLCDRRADTIISGGVNIYPAQIEAVLLELACVADCCVVGAPNEEWGEEVRAVVQRVEDDARSDDAVAEEIRAHCRKRLAGYEVPRAVDFDPALPRTETGKLARRSVRERYWRDHARRL